MEAGQLMKMMFEDGDGIESANVERGSEDASLIGSYWHAVGDFLSSDPDDPNYPDVIERLHDFDNFEINGRYAMTDEEDLEDLANEGELSFDDIYEDA